MKKYFALLLLVLSTILVVALTYTPGTRLPEQRVSQSASDGNSVSESPGKVGGPSTGEVKLSHIGEPTNEFFSSIHQAPEIQAGGREQFSGDLDYTRSVDGALQLFNAPGATRTRALAGDSQNQTSAQSDGASVPQRIAPRPMEGRLRKAGRSFDGDVRDLPREKLVEQFRNEPEEPVFNPRFIGLPAMETPQGAERIEAPAAPAVAAPTPLLTFDGLDRFNWGAGSPPDTNGDVGPNHYIQTVNTSVGIFDKTTGSQTAAFTFNTLMSQGSFGNLCDTNNFGDPVVLYDTFEDRWIITDFAFLLDGSGNVLAPAFQCFAASKTPDPVAGGWNFYSIQISDSLNDYPKFGIWPDGVYMTTNLFSFGAGSFQGVRVWAFNKAQMYAGAPTVQNVSFNVGGGDFTIIPSNARLQTGTPPTGTPNYFLSTWLFTNALTVYKFHVDWDRISLSTFTGPDTPLAATSWPNANVANAAQPGAVPTPTPLDVIQIRAMVQNQYTNIGGAESLWVPHTVRRGNTSGLAAPRWYQVNVTGGTVAAALPQATTWDPDGANVINRFMPSLALDRAGNMALGYSTSSGTAFPSIKYAGRLSTDPVNTFSLTESSLFDGTASQTGALSRWGDYSAMTVDPDGCTFWYTSQYANPADQTFNHRWLTRIGKFKYVQCTTIGRGTLQGTVTVTPGGAPISGATVAFGARTTTTDSSGFYSFAAIPAGTYPTETASNPAFVSSTITNIVINESATTVKDFALSAAPASSCLTDTTQADFQTGVFTSLDLDTTPGNVTLLSAPTVDQANTAGTNTGTSFNSTSWGGQTFTAAVTGTLVKADVQLFCSGCTGTTPNLTVSVRNTTAGLPTGADLATATIPGFSSGSGIYYTATFGAPATLTSGTQYALLLRPVANPSVGTGYLWIRASPSSYANGQRVTTADSGGTWAADSTRDFNFRAYMQTGFAASGNLVSSVKDSNPGGAATFPHWASLSWTATVPANTTLKFQVAGSNNPGGPFNFVGPDNTGATFFTTSPATNINILNGNRYLKYKAYLTTTNSAVTPTLNDVTVCFNNTSAPTASDGVVSGRITNSDGAAVAGAVVHLSGTQNRKFITDADGAYRFDNVETAGFYTVTPSLGGYHFSPEDHSFSLIGNNVSAVFTATRDISGSSAIETPEYFVRQQYLDFLGREPDESGFNFWSDQILSCAGDAQCIERRTISVSAAYFLSIEFQQTGGLVDGMYRASYGRQPLYAEFMPDTGAVAHNVVVGRSDWTQQLEANKQAFVAAWVERPDFRAAYDGLANTAFVDTLIAHAGAGFNGDRAALVRELNGGTMTRAAVLRQVVENEGFVNAKRNETFVVMEYFGYLRRDPDASGYAFWLNKLIEFNGDFERAEMVKAFINSGEYRQRFAQ